eukprot:1953443-Rhodomonas_salina.2
MSTSSPQYLSSGACLLIHKLGHLHWQLLFQSEEPTDNSTAAAIWHVPGVPGYPGTRVPWGYRVHQVPGTSTNPGTQTPAGPGVAQAINEAFVLTVGFVENWGRPADLARRHCWANPGPGRYPGTWVDFYPTQTTTRSLNRQYPGGYPGIQGYRKGPGIHGGPVFTAGGYPGTVRTRGTLASDGHRRRLLSKSGN